MRKQLLIIITFSFVIICGYLIWNNQKTNTSIIDTKSKHTPTTQKTERTRDAVLTNIKSVNQRQKNNANSMNKEIFSLIAVLEDRSTLFNNINIKELKKHEIEELKKHEAERIKAANKLRKLKAREALEVFERITMDNTESNSLRDEAIRGLGEIGGEQYIPIFSSVLEDAKLDVNLRITASFVLGKFNSIEAVEALSRGIHDEDNNIRFKSIQCLGETKNSAAIQYILEGLNDSDIYVKHISIVSLGNMGAYSSVQKIKEVFNTSNDGFIKEACLNAIEKLSVE